MTILLCVLAYLGIGFTIAFIGVWRGHGLRDVVLLLVFAWPIILPLELLFRFFEWVEVKGEEHRHKP